MCQHQNANQNLQWKLMVKSCTNVANVMEHFKEKFNWPITGYNISITCVNVTEVTESIEFLGI